MSLCSLEKSHFVEQVAAISANLLNASTKCNRRGNVHEEDKNVSPHTMNTENYNYLK